MVQISQFNALYITHGLCSLSYILGTDKWSVVSDYTECYARQLWLAQRWPNERRHSGLDVMQITHAICSRTST